MQTEPAEMLAHQIENIQWVVCRKYDLTMEQLLGHQRSAHIAQPRQEAVYICSTATTASLPEIGWMFNRDHSTVLHSIRAHKKRMGL